MFDKLEAVEKRFVELDSKLADPDVISRRNEFQKLSKEHADIAELVDVLPRYKAVHGRARGQQAAPRGEGRRDAGDGARGAGAARRRGAGARGAAASSSFCRRIRTTTRTSSSRCAAAPVARRPRCSPPICSACTRATPSASAGSSRSCRSRTRAAGGSRKSSR